jgi:pilus assembly protein CpaB
MQETKRRGWILTVIAGFLAVVTGFFFFSYLNRLERMIGDTVAVVVAAEDIPARTVLTPDLLDTLEIPRQFAHDSYVFNANDVRDYVVIANIQAGQIIQKNMIDANAGLRPGFRAVALAADQVSSVGGNIRPGNRVDVVVSYVDGAEQGQTAVLLENIEVLAVNSLLPSGSEALPGTVATSRFLPSGQMIKDAVVTLALTPEDAAQLIYMTNFGTDVRLVIRRLDEPDARPVAPVTIDDFAP